MTDYRQFRLSKLNDPTFSHLKLLLYWPIYGLVFLTLDMLAQVGAQERDIEDIAAFVGQVEGVFTDPSGMNRYAVVEPDVDLDSLVEVFVIKSFDIVECRRRVSCLYRRFIPCSG